MSMFSRRVTDRSMADRSGRALGGGAGVPRNGRPSSRSRAFEALEARYALSAAFDVTGLTALRGDSRYVGVDGSDIGVAIIDSGVYSVHPDLQPNFVAWYDAVKRTESGSPIDPDGHGTHVAGTAASRNPAVGVATQAKIIGIRGLPADGERQPQHDTVADGLQWVINNHQKYNIKVVNMSLGVPGVNVNTPQPRTEADASRIAQLEALGVTVVTASGNGYADFAVPGASVPAAYSTIQVANTWEDSGAGDDLPSIGAGGGNSQFAGIDFRPRADQFSATSQRSSLPNQVAAPGSTIYSTWNGEGGKLYNTISGTSMASPMVAGMVALMQDAARTFGGVYLAPAQVLQILRDTADEIVDSPTDSNARAEIVRDIFGRASLGQQQPLNETGLTYKRVNIHRAIQQVVATVQGGTIDNPPPAGTDTNSTISTATVVPNLDGTRIFTFSGNVSSDGSVAVGARDVDLFKVVTDSPGNVVFTSKSVTGGTAGVLALRLFDGTGTELSKIEGTTGSGYPTLTSGRLSPGTYYLGVSSVGNVSYSISNSTGLADGTSAGDFAVDITLTNPDPNGVVQGAVPYEGLPNYYPGFIGADLGLEVGSQDVDFFEVLAPDTGTLTVDIDAVSVYGSEAVDSYVRVFNDQLTQLAANDDEGSGNLDSFLTLPVTRGQRLYVAVANFDNRAFNPSDPFDRSVAGAGGFYDIYLRFSNSDEDGTVLSANPATIGTPINGSVEKDGSIVVGRDGSKDVDFHLFEPSQNGLLDMSITPESGFVASLSIWVYDSTQGDVVRVGEVTSSSPRLIAPVIAGEAYYVAVTGRGNTGFDWFSVASGSGGMIGDYTLTSSLRPAGDVKTLINDSINTGTPTAISLGASVAGEIGADDSYVVGTSDVDLFVFTPTTTGSVLIRASAGEDRDGIDAFLRVFNSSGTELSFNDDLTNQTLDSGLFITVQAGQTYYIGVNAAGSTARDYNPVTGSGATPGKTGDYVLSVTSNAKFSATPGAVFGASGGVAGNINVSSVNGVGNPVIFQQTAGLTTWTATDLQSKTGSPQILGDVVTWVDPKDGRNHAAARTTAGLGLFTNTSGSSWTFRNLTTSISGAGTISGPITVFTSTTGLVSVAGVESDGDLLLYTQTGGGTAGNYTWTATNLGEELRSQGLVMPRFVGSITSFVTPWNALNVVGLDAQGDVQAVWFHASLASQKWTTNNLSDTTGAPPMTGGLTVWQTSWSAINIGGVDSSGTLYATWWLPEFGAEWRVANMTQIVGGPTFTPGSVSSFVTPWGAMNISGRESNGTVTVYWWEPIGQIWQVARISDVIPNATTTVGAITALTTTGTFSMNLIGASASGDVIRSWWSVGTGVWAEQNLTQTAAEI